LEISRRGQEKEEEEVIFKLSINSNLFLHHNFKCLKYKNIKNAIK
jgi:hypothetical protein